MKLTDLALIFIGVTLPIMIIVYVNVSFTIKAEEQEMYYQKVINIATEDAANQMKEVENSDPSIDYGYSGLEDKKVSVNAEIAKNTFFETMYNTLGIKGNEAAERYLQTFIPCLAIIDYNGVYISSEETYDDKTKTPSEKRTEHVVKPKRYYTYSYYIDTSNNFVEGLPNNVAQAKEIHTVEFTMDDYITHRGCHKNLGSWEDDEVKGFYITDIKNNSVLCYNKDIEVKFDNVKNFNFNNNEEEEIYADGQNINAQKIASYLNSIRKQVIIDTITEEIAYATNKANSYAKAIGINYDFVFPKLTENDMESAIEDIGIFAFIQGLNIGNKYLNAKSYSISKLESTVRYYFSLKTSAANLKTGEISINDIDIVKKYNKLGMNYYHNNINCSLYKAQTHDGITPTYVLTKQQAASAQVSKRKSDGGDEYQDIYEGFYPCPMCNP